MDLIQYSKKDFYNMKESHQVSDETYDNYEEIINLINSQLFQNNKYQGNRTSKEWRRKKLPSFLDRKVSEEDKLKNNVNLELNKLSIENYRSIFTSIKKILNNASDDKYTDLISLIIDSVFEKAVIQPDYCPQYVKLVFSLVNNDNKTLIMTLLRNKCTTYHQILTKKIDGNNIDKVSSSKLEADDEEDDNEEESTDYDEICRQQLRKQYKKGFSQFVGELYNYEIITTREILFFYRKMLSNALIGLNDKIDEDFIEDNILYFHKLLEVSIDRLTSRQKKNTNPIFQIMRNIEELIEHKNISFIPGRLKFKLNDCHDILKHALRKR